MRMNSLQDLYVDQLQDLYSAETQLVQALPKMASAAYTDELRKGFQVHLEQTRTHVNRLDQIFSRIGSRGGSNICEGMQGLIKEGEEAIALDGDPKVRDAALIAAAQRVEHYEIAGYGTVRTYAKDLGFSSDSSLLQKSLDEEAETDKKLTKLAEGGLFKSGINDQASREEPVMSGRRA
jgi:ferritin-like metal-binding protein YciE